jgi:putative transposase
MVKLRKGRTVPKFGRAWVVIHNGRWYANFECDRAVEPLPTTGITLGIDCGVHVLAALSDGRLVRNIGVGEHRKAAVARMQRQVEKLTQRDAAGRVRNVNDARRQAAVLRLARAKEREANIRRDYAHKRAREIVKNADVIGLEKLNLRAMTRSARGSVANPGRRVAAKAGLNRRILDAGFGLLRRIIVAKAEEAARTVVEVDARFSSQECSRCGQIARESRRRRRFHCVECGYVNHADVNAALVIRRRAQSALMSEPNPAEDAGHRTGCAA